MGFYLLTYQQIFDLLKNHPLPLWILLIISVSEIKQLLRRSSNAFCESDPMPTWFVKECQDILNGPVAKLVNTSLSFGVYEICSGKVSNKKDTVWTVMF